MSIAQRRDAVRVLVTHGLSVQRACVLVQLSRASYHYQPRSVACDGLTTEIAAMDEFTREGLAIDVDTSTSAERVIGVLGHLVAAHGAPAYLRSDNGSEFVAVAVQAWLAQRQIH